MRLARDLASSVAIASFVLAAIFAGMYLLGVGQPDDTELIAPQDGFTSVSVPAQEGQPHVDERLVAPAEDTPSFA